MEFGKKIGWAQLGLLVSAALLALVGVLYLVAGDIMPHALHNPAMPVDNPNYHMPVGTWIIAAAMAAAGVCQFAAYKMAGGSRVLGGWLVMSAIIALFWAFSAVIDPWVGTFSFEWVDAIYLAFLGLCVAAGALFSGRTIGYKGWLIDLALGLVLVALCLGIVLNSANAHELTGIGFIVYAVIVALVPVMGKDLKVA